MGVYPIQVNCGIYFQVVIKRRKKHFLYLMPVGFHGNVIWTGLMVQVVEQIHLVNENEKIIHATILLVFTKIVIDKTTHYDIIRVVSKRATKQIKIKGSEKLLLFYWQLERQQLFDYSLFHSLLTSISSESFYYLLRSFQKYDLMRL